MPLKVARQLPQRPVNPLRISNVDPFHNKIHVRESLSEFTSVQHLVPSRTRGERSVTMPPTLLRMPREYVAEQPANGLREFLSRDPDDAAKPLDHTNWFYRSVFKPAIRRALPASLHGPASGTSGTGARRS